MVQLDEPVLDPRLTGVVAELHDGGDDLDEVAREVVALNDVDETRVVLTRTTLDLLDRLHQNSGDYAASVALRAVSRASALLAEREPPSWEVASPLRIRLRRLRVPALLALVLLGIGLAASINLAALFYAVFLVASLAIGLVCWTTLVWMVDAWRTPEAFDHTRSPTEAPARHLSFSLIVPARHEEQVLGATLARLAATEHPDFEVVVVVGEDDDATRLVAERAALAHPELVRVVVDDSWPKNKPKALNTALPYCRGEIIGVFDAEDEVAPELIERVDRCFQESRADVVQAGVQLVNIRSSWFACRNALEYYFWFRSRLHFHARAGFIPLGGNTVFVRAEVLRAVGGWDAECLAEDCELGVRLSSLGAKTVVFYEPALATREETPPTLRAFVRQRTRWSQGYLQTLSRSYWRLLPRRQRWLGLYTLAMPYLMAFVWIMLPLAIITALLVRAPVAISLLSFLPAIPMLAVLAVEIAGLGELCRSFGLRTRASDYGRLALSLPLYQVVLSFASARAVAREARGTRGWEKTEHFGLHLAPDAATIDLTDEAHLVGAGAPLVTRPTGYDDGHAAAGGRSTERAATTDGMVGSPVASAVLSPAVIDLAPDDTGTPLWLRLRDAEQCHAGPSGAPVAIEPAAEPAVAPVADDEAAQGARTRTGASPAVLVGLIGFFLFVAWVQVTNLAHWPAPFFDEGTYIANAWAVPRGALSNYTYGYGHPPLAWILVTLWTWVTSAFGRTEFSVTAGRELMIVGSITSCVLLYVLARRLGLARITGVIAVALFACSPLALYFHRLVLIDNPGVTFALAALVLALNPSRRLWLFAASGACFTASVLCKESMLILLPAVVLAAVQNSDRRTRRYTMTLFGACFALALAVYPLYAALKGELFPGAGHVSLLGEAQTQLFGRKATGSILDPQSQTRGIVEYWLHLDPWLLGLGLLFLPLGLARRRTRVAAVALAMQMVMVLRPGYLPFMYVIGLLPFAALVVAGGVEWIWRVAASPGHTRHGARIPDFPRLSDRIRSPRVARAIPPVAVAALLTVTGLFWFGGGRHWVDADRAAMTLALDGPHREAQQWILGHIGPDDHVLVADDFWVFMVEHGYEDEPVTGGFFSRTVVFYWPFDFDPAVRRVYPAGWKQLDYVVSTEGMRNDGTLVPRTAAALEHSRVVATFGRGPTRIEIRAIERPPGPSPTPTPGTPGAAT